MKQVTEKAIILKRIDFGEADRIMTVLTASAKKSMLAKGVRRPKSKLAGGLELFSETVITYIDGRSDLKTVISTRLDVFYKHIVKDYARTMIGYECAASIEKHVEHECDEAYYTLLKTVFESLNNPELDERLTSTWFRLSFLDLIGNGLQLDVSAAGKKLTPDAKFDFSFDEMAFFEKTEGQFTPSHIKFLRLCRRASSPQPLSSIKDWEDLVDASLWLVTHAQKYSS